MRLRTRVVVALLSVAVVLSLVSLAGFTMYRDAIVTQEREDLEQTTEFIADQLSAVLAEKERTVFLWSHRPGLGTHGSEAQQDGLREFVASTGFSGASVIASDGTMTAIEGEGIEPDSELVGQDFGDRRYFRRAMYGETYISDPVHAESGNVIVTISTPILRSGETRGTFNAAFHVHRGDLFESIRAREDGTEQIRVVANGSAIYRTHTEQPPGDVLVRANATVERTGWTVAGTRTTGAMQPRLRTVSLLQVGTLALVVLSMASLGGWLYREYIRNFERLEEGFAALVAGDYGTTVSLQGSTEWQEVGTHFNELSETLAQRRVEVAVLNRVLRHNLRNAMTVVTGNADYIAGHAEDEQLAGTARTIRDRGESLLDLAEQARTLESSLRVGGRASPARPVEGIVREAVAALHEESPGAVIDVGRVPPGVEVPEGDLVAVVVDELVSNAVMHGSQTVEIDVEVHDDAVSVIVDDDGPGLPEIERKILEGPFVETPTEHGTGLGLWIVKWIVDHLGGSVTVDTDDGTTVRATLPRAAAE